MDPLIWFVIVIVVIFGAFALFRRPRGPTRGRAELVHTLMADVNIAQALVDNFGVRPVPLAFQTGTWFANKFEFLGESVRKDLDAAFHMARDFNDRLKVAKKSKPATVKLELDVEKMRELLAAGKKGLENWLLTNVGTLERKQKYPSIMSGLFGGDS
jgi:hypothetical protein